MKKIKSALISVFYKDGLDKLVQTLADNNVKIYSTGGTQAFIENLGIPVTAIENITSYPSILGGRVKTLHPKVFGGILGRRNLESDMKQMDEYGIPEIDLVIVNLYPFEETVQSGADNASIIEKIDIGGISLIRAAAKNYNDTLTVSDPSQYIEIDNILSENNANCNLETRRKFAAEAFNISSHYDSAIYNYFQPHNPSSLKLSIQGNRSLRYGENPHQKGVFYGDLDQILEQFNGKEISYNNLLDIDAAVKLILDFKNKPTFAILKHNNACGLAVRDTLVEAYKDALAGDPISAFGGVLICNKPIDIDTAEEINKLFCEVLIAPQYQDGSLDILKQKKNRIILKFKNFETSNKLYRSILNGVLSQDTDNKRETKDDLTFVTKTKSNDNAIDDLLFANIIVKHTKSNAIVLAKNNQLIASGVGQTSRVDALKQAIEKAKTFNFDLQNAVMASDAFFPFPDCVEIAGKEGIKSVIQPGGSIRDKDSIEYCDNNNICMAFTGHRHFKH